MAKPLSLNPIIPNPPRWEPSSDPAAIVVPGLDTNASVSDQIDQIEQLITLKLQNIDANFSKIQHLMATRLLPAVKRFAVGTEPVRDAAKFWTSFYEQTAQVRLPTYEEYSTVHEQESQETSEDASATSTATPMQPSRDDSTVISSESSFLPTQADYASTPATVSRRSGRDTFTAQDNDDTVSWSASVESPLVRLDRQIQDLTKEDEDSLSNTTPEATPRPVPSSSGSGPSQSAQPKGKDKEPLIRNGFRQNMGTANAPSGAVFHLKPPAKGVSPLKLKPKPKTPIPKKLNPYLPPNSDPRDWNGVVDLADESITSPKRARHDAPYQPSPQRRTPGRSTTPVAKRLEDDDSFEDSTLDLPPGMSPPVTMQMARPSRTSLIPRLSRTPKREAVGRIKQNVLVDVSRASSSRVTGTSGSFIAKYNPSLQPNNKGVESSMSTVPTPPSLSRYSRHAYPDGINSSTSGIDASLEALMRRVGMVNPAHSSQASMAAPTVQPNLPRTPEQPRYDFYPMDEQDLSTAVPLPDSDSDSDSMDEEANNTANPSAAFIMASQRPRDPDDSFGSDNSSDSFDDDPGDAGAPLFTAAAPEDSFGDDSFDDDAYNNGPSQETETLFGVSAAQRQTQHSHEGLRMMGQDVLQDTLGIGTALERAGQLEESPTPWGRETRR